MSARPLKMPAVATLAHFTRAGKTASALDNLVAILRDGVIRGSTRMVRERRAVVCLFDVPVRDLRLLLDRRNRHRYEPFGIAIEKRYAFRMGARPAIYMPWREAENLLAPGERWRVVALELEPNKTIDWSYEREWRLAGDLTLPAGRAVALVESWRDADEIYDRFQGRPPCAGVIPLRELLGTF
jgi:hypothetical protein